MAELLRKPLLPEYCEGEIHDFLVELIRKEVKNIPEETKCRRREICEALLACTVLKGWNAQESQIAALEKLGFGVTKGRKHYKLRRDNSAFFTSVSATPSDKRAGANLTAEFVKLFF